MTEKVNLPVRKFIEQKISDNFRDLDFRRGTAFNDLFAKPAAMLFQPFRHELNMLKINQSILNFDNMSSADVDLLIGNFFIRRAKGLNASGNVRVYFRDPGIYRFERIIFLTQSGLRFLNTSIINTTVEGLLANRSEDGLYFLDVFVQSEGVGPQYSVKSGEIQLIENQPQQILKCENIDDFAMVTDEEDNAQLYAKARRSIAVRNLINDSSIQSVLFNEFAFIRDIFVVGAGDPEMVRDLITVPTIPPSQLHIGGMTDVYIDTTGITAYELNINSIPETGTIDCVSSPQQTLLYKFESGVLDDTFFYDFNHRFWEGDTQLVQRGNFVKVITREFGETVTRDYRIEQVLEDSKLRLSGGLKTSVLDGVVFDSGNIVYDFIQGNFGSIYKIIPGEYLSYGPGDAWKLGRVYDSFLEVVPPNHVILDLVFNNDIDRDGTTATINFTGIGGVLASPTEVQVGDYLEMVSSNAWGRYIVHERVDDDNITVFPESAVVNTTTITFTGLDTFTGTANVGEYITVNDTSPINQQTYLVIAPGQTDRAHNQAAALNCFVTDKVLQENIPANTPFKILRTRVKDAIPPIGADAIINPIAPGAYWFETANGSQFRVGDKVFFDVESTVIGIEVTGTTKIQCGSPVTAIGQPPAVTPVISRYSSNIFTNPNVLFNRYVHTGQFKQDITGVTATLADLEIGINAWPGYRFIIHDGDNAGIYTIDAANALNPNSITLSAPITAKIKAGNAYSIIASITQPGSAHDDVLYVPTFVNDLTAVAGSFPNSAVDHLVYITCGPNKGVYEVTEYIDPNRVKINGSLSSSGEKIVVEVKFNNFTASGSTTIVESGTPFSAVQQYDTLVINRQGTKSYHMINNVAGGNTLTINPALDDDIVGGSTQYTIVRDQVNPFVIITSQIPFEIHSLPAIRDRRSEGTHGQCTANSFIFSDPDSNFLDIFDGVNAAGYELYIIEGTHARAEPYIIQSISTPTSLVISNTSYDDSTSDSPNFDAGTGFIGGTTPVQTEKYEIRKNVSLLSPISYELYEDYSYYAGEFFRLPILALRDITLIDPVTGQLSTTPLVEPTDFTLGVKNSGTRYSVEERPVIQFTDPNAFKYKQVRIRYYSDPNIKVVHDFCSSKANRITNNSLLVKRMESTFVEIDISMEGNVEKQVAEDTINEYITTRKSGDPIEASDIIQKLYEVGVNYVDTETLNMKAIYYTSDGQRLESVSRTRIVSPSTATYIPGAININLTSTT